MKYAIAAVFVIAASIPAYSFAVTPVTVVKGPPASLKMEVHMFGVHDMYLTLPSRPPSYVPSPIKITLSRGPFEHLFQVDVAYKELPDGRIYFRLDIPQEEESNYQIQVV